jgi:DNA-binding NarL/FixJ family response regulator
MVPAPAEEGRVTIRVVLADDQELVRTGFRMILGAEPDVDIVADARNGQEAVEAVVRHQPDIVLMDIRMPVLDGVAATRRIVSAPRCRTRVVILTTFDDDASVYEALAAGASGFLLKDATATELVAAVRVVADGEAMLTPSITRRVIERVGQRHAGGADVAAVQRLSQREREVLRLMADGLSNAEIGRELVVSEATVKTHVARILQKLPARDRVQAVVTAYRAGLPYEPR